MNASKYGHIEIVKELIERGADINAENWKKKTALYYAFWNYHQDIVALLSALKEKEFIKDASRFFLMQIFL